MVKALGHANSQSGIYHFAKKPNIIDTVQECPPDGQAFGRVTQSR